MKDDRQKWILIIVASAVVCFALFASDALKVFENRSLFQSSGLSDVVKGVTQIQKGMKGAKEEIDGKIKDDESGEGIASCSFVALQNGYVLVKTPSGDEQRIELADIKVSDSSKINALLKKGDTLLIELNGENKGYVYASDGTMIQEWLLENGAAKCNLSDNSRYSESFIKAQRKSESGD